MSESVFKKLVVCALLLQVAFNSSFDCKFIKENILFWPSFPGEYFLPFKPFFRGIRVVGFYSDYVSPINREMDSDFLVAPQRAQYALSPTILDYYHPFSHEFIILRTKNDFIIRQLLYSLKATLIVRFKEGFCLIRRDLP